MTSDLVRSLGGEDQKRLLRRADLYFRLASLARNPETAARLDGLARRFSAEAATPASHA